MGLHGHRQDDRYHIVHGAMIADRVCPGSMEQQKETVCTNETSLLHLCECGFCCACGAPLALKCGCCTNSVWCSFYPLEQLHSFACKTAGSRAEPPCFNALLVHGVFNVHLQVRERCSGCSGRISCAISRFSLTSKINQRYSPGLLALLCFPQVNDQAAPAAK